MFRSETIGYLCLSLAAIFWASSGTAAKALMQSGISPSELVQIRVTLSSILIGLCIAVAAPRLFRTHERDWILLAAIGVVMALWFK